MIREFIYIFRFMLKTVFFTLINDNSLRPNNFLFNIRYLFISKRYQLLIHECRLLLPSFRGGMWQGPPPLRLPANHLDQLHLTGQCGRPHRLHMIISDDPPSNALDITYRRRLELLLLPPESLVRRTALQYLSDCLVVSGCCSLPSVATL
jgi:hypothetical protein